MRLLCILILSLTVSVQAGITLGTNTLVALPSAAEWNLAVNWHPGSNEVVAINPPVFSWPYQTNFPLSVNNVAAREFQFQVSTAADFSALKVNVKTPWNFYNFLAPFTNGVGPYYWKIGHITGGATNYYFTNQFTLSATAQSWDRSMLASDSYLTNKTHPYLLFTNEQKVGLANFLSNNLANYLGSTGQQWERVVGGEWAYARHYAYTETTNSWVTNFASTNNLIAFSSRCVYLANIAFVWSMTNDVALTNSNPMHQLRYAAQYFMDYGLWNTDPVGDQSVFAVEHIANAYDMWFDYLTAEDKSVIEQMFDWHANAILHSSQPHVNYYIPTSSWNQTNYTGDYETSFSGPSGTGSSHWFDWHYTGMFSALAGFKTSTNCRALLDMGLNYLIARATPFGDKANVNQGRSYGLGGIRSIYNVSKLAQNTFPEANFRTNPIIQTNIQWMSRIMPAGWVGGNEPWGDGSYGLTGLWDPRTFGRDFACITGSGVAWQHWLSVGGDLLASFSSSVNDYANMGTPYLFSPPSPLTNTADAILFHDDGWVISASQPSNVKAGFTNAVGFIFQARPRGSEVGHSHPSDLSFQMWAYGAQITDSGADYLAAVSQTPLATYGLLVNGVGTIQGYFRQSTNWCAKFIGFTNGSDFTYVAAEGVNAYPRIVQPPTGGDTSAEYVGYQGTPPLGLLQSVQRHILFPRKKYFVLHDSFVTSSNATFTQLYHILEPTLTNLTATGFQYTCTNQIAGGSNITVHVFQCTSGIGVTNMTGSSVYRNPINNTNYPVGSDPHPRSSVLWWTNTTATTNFSFTTVVVPQESGKSAPTFLRLDNNTVAVTYDGVTETNTFGTNYGGAFTYRVSLAESEPEPSPRIVRINSGTTRVTGGTVTIR